MKKRAHPIKEQRSPEQQIKALEHSIAKFGDDKDHTKARKIQKIKSLVR